MLYNKYRRSVVFIIAVIITVSAMVTTAMTVSVKVKLSSAVPNIIFVVIIAAIILLLILLMMVGDSVWKTSFKFQVRLSNDDNGCFDDGQMVIEMISTVLIVILYMIHVVMGYNLTEYDGDDFE
jgi:hypothetical protein